MSIDLADIESRINEGIYGDDRMSNTARDDAFSALAVLLAEVERLREDVATFSDDFRRVTSETCAPDELHCSCVPHLRAEVAELRALGVSLHKSAAMGRDTERAAMVAWLQRMAANARHWGGSLDERAEIYDRLADVFECGEHRREENE